MPIRDVPATMAERLIVALDVPTIEGARRRVCRELADSQVAQPPRSL